MKTTMTHHPLKAEWLNDQHGPAIMLTQQGDYSEPGTVLMHPWQLRALCEHFGLVTADPKAAQTIAAMQRRMLALRDRIDDLGHYMTHYSDHKHADLSHELNTINMLAELADEWCNDFEGEPTTPMGDCASRDQQIETDCNPDGVKLATSSQAHTPSQACLL